MRRSAVILAWILVCLCLLSGCANKKDHSGADLEPDNSAEIGIITAEEGGIGISVDEGITYSLKDPENSDGIVVVPRQ